MEKHEKKLHASKESPIKKATKHIARNVVNAVTEQVAKVPVQSYFQWYQRGLLENPYMFKGLTSTTLKMLSDMTGQLISEGKVVSFRTMVSFGMFGFFIDSPLCHNWYAFVNRVTPQYTGGSLFLTTAINCALDQFLFNPFYYVVWMISFGYMAGSFESWEEATDKVKRDLWPAMLAAWRVWPFYTFISMYFLPEEWWMPVGYFVGYCFNTYLKLLQWTLSAASVVKTFRRCPARGIPIKPIPSSSTQLDPSASSIVQTCMPNTQGRT